MGHQTFNTRIKGNFTPVPEYSKLCGHLLRPWALLGLVLAPPYLLLNFLVYNLDNLSFIYSISCNRTQTASRFSIIKYFGGNRT